MPTPETNDVKDLQYQVGRLAGAVEALVSRMNRQDDWLGGQFGGLNTKIDNHLIPLNSRVTVIEAQRGRVAIPSAGIGAIVGAFASALLGHFWH